MNSPQIIPCATEADWRRERAFAIGASEVPDLFGVGYRTPLQRWRLKKGLDTDDEESEAMTAGKFMEAGNAAWYAHANHRKVITPQEFFGHPEAYAVIVRHPTLPLQCTPDRIVFESSIAKISGPLQLKSVTEWMLDEWEDGSSPPLKVQCQVQAELLCLGMVWGAIGAVIGGNKRRDADVHAHQRFHEALAAKVQAFWESLQRDTPPAPVAADLAGIRERFPLSNEGQTIEYPSPEDIMELARVKGEISGLEEHEKALLAKIQGIVISIGDGQAEILTGGGQKLATWKSTIRHDPAREARETPVRRFLIDPKLLKLAKSMYARHDAILPA